MYSFVYYWPKIGQLYWPIKTIGIPSELYSVLLAKNWQLGRRGEQLICESKHDSLREGIIWIMYVHFIIFFPFSLTGILPNLVPYFYLFLSLSLSGILQNLVPYFYLFLILVFYKIKYHISISFSFSLTGILQN